MEREVERKKLCVWMRGGDVSYGRRKKGEEKGEESDELQRGTNNEETTSIEYAVKNEVKETGCTRRKCSELLPPTLFELLLQQQGLQSCVQGLSYVL